MAEYKLLALDMDGTLLNDEQQISKENRRAIQEALAAGLIVSFATGRGVQNVLPYTDDLQLETPLVTVNGGEIWKAPGKLHKRHYIAWQQIEQLYKLAHEYGIWFWAYSSEGMLNQDSWQPDAADREWMKFGFYTENDAIRAQIWQQINAWDTLELTNSHPHNIECNPKGVNKANGLQEVCRLLNIEMHEIVAMGDSLNDLAMIRSAGLGVAMGNAQDEIKRAADLVTVTNEEHGVARIIYDMILK